MVPPMNQSDPRHDPQDNLAHEPASGSLSARARAAVAPQSSYLNGLNPEQLGLSPHVEHYAETVGDEPCVDLSIFTPKRDEYAAEEGNAPRSSASSSQGDDLADSEEGRRR